MKYITFILLVFYILKGYGQNDYFVCTVFNYNEGDSSNMRLISKSFWNLQHQEDSCHIYDKNGEISSRDYYKYDSFGNLIFEISYDWPHRSDSMKIIYTYNDKGNKVKIEEYETINNNWRKTEENIMQYDNKDNLIKTFCSQYNNWSDCYTVYYDYDSLNRISRKKIYDDDRLFSEENYKYNNEGYIVYYLIDIDNPYRYKHHLDSCIYETDLKNRIIEGASYSNGECIFRETNEYEDNLIKKSKKQNILNDNYPTIVLYKYERITPHNNK